ncbi:hypothetical protein MRB53_041039 [Persea americana]|nr:hypothetical protein MRB53_041039 [Persea americana]
MYPRHCFRDYSTRQAPVIAYAEGSFQILADDHYFLGYGARPFIKEFSGEPKTGGNVLWNGLRYQLLRLAWWSQGRAQMMGLVSCAGSSQWRGFVSWNGATNVTGYTVLTGSTSTDLRKTATIQKLGFETEFIVPSDAKYVQVVAEQCTGLASSNSQGRSNIVQKSPLPSPPSTCVFEDGGKAGTVYRDLRKLPHGRMLSSGTSSVGVVRFEGWLCTIGMSMGCPETKSASIWVVGAALMRGCSNYRLQLAVHRWCSSSDILTGGSKRRMTVVPKSSPTEAKVLGTRFVRRADNGTVLFQTFSVQTRVKPPAPTAKLAITNARVWDGYKVKEPDTVFINGEKDCEWSAIYGSGHQWLEWHIAARIVSMLMHIRARLRTWRRSVATA